MGVTPQAGAADQIAVGGTAVTAVAAVAAGIGGCIITNPYSAVDQGIVAAETIYIDPTGAAATLNGNGTTFALAPGQSWSGIAGQVTATLVNATTTGHKFSVIWWNAS